MAENRNINLIKYKGKWGRMVRKYKSEIDINSDDQ
jgi:hypothetical protein